MCVRVCVTFSSTACVPLARLLAWLWRQRKGTRADAVCCCVTAATARPRLALCLVLVPRLLTAPAEERQRRPTDGGIVERSTATTRLGLYPLCISLRGPLSFLGYLPGCGTVRGVATAAPLAGPVQPPCHHLHASRRGGCRLQLLFLFCVVAHEAWRACGARGGRGHLQGASAPLLGAARGVHARARSCCAPHGCSAVPGGVGVARGVLPARLIIAVGSTAVQLACTGAAANTALPPGLLSFAASLTACEPWIRCAATVDFCLHARLRARLRAARDSGECTCAHSDGWRWRCMHCAWQAGACCAQRLYAYAHVPAEDCAQCAHTWCCTCSPVVWE